MTTQRAGRTARRFVVGGAMAMAIMVTLTATPAAAFTQQRWGYPGAISVPYQVGYGTPNNHTSSNRIVSGYIRADRSSYTSGTQLITIEWRVWSVQNGQWTKIAGPSSTYTVYPGQYVGMSGWTVSDYWGSLYSTDLRITWRTSGGGFIGQVYIDFVHTNDYRCGTVSPSCYMATFGGQAAMSLN